MKKQNPVDHVDPVKKIGQDELDKLDKNIVFSLCKSVAKFMLIQSKVFREN